jgi:CelD/BcsL family acetyltransferase involved in cellulose biosynthesis
MGNALARSTDLFQSHDWDDMDLEAMRLDAMLENGEFVIRTLRDPADARSEWLALQDNSFGTMFTSHEWLSSWFSHVARARGIEALIVVGDIDGQPAFLLPLAIMPAARGLLRVGRFLGDFHGNQNSGLWRKDILAGIHGQSLHKALLKVGREHGIDLFDLKYVPAEIDGRIHPLVDRHAIESLNAVHALPLEPDFETLYRNRRSSSARKKLRTKEKKLAETGALSCRKAGDAETALHFLDTLVAQRSARQASQGIPNVFEPADVRAFLSDQLLASLREGDNRVTIHALEAGGRIRATYLCGMQFGRYHAYTNSIDEDVAACSPGDILLNHVIADACRSGAESFDFGLGAERYKTAWADKEVLMDVKIPVTTKGHAAQEAIRHLRQIKRRIRNTPALWSIVRALRKLRA